MTEHEVTEILLRAGSLKFPDVMRHFVVELARHYRYGRLTAEPPRSETRYQLLLMAHLAWRAKQPGSRHLACKREIARLIFTANRATKHLLLEQVQRLTGDTSRPAYAYFYQDWLDCDLIGKAAVEAASQKQGRGDYKNHALASTVQNMAFVFECCCGMRPTFSRKQVGAESADGTCRTIAASEFGEFMLAFFRLADPLLPETQVTNAIERELALIRRMAAGDPYYYRDLPNLLYAP